MKVGDIVRDSTFNELHRVLILSKPYVYVENLSGPGSYEGEEAFLLSQLEVVHETRSGKRVAARSIKP